MDEAAFLAKRDRDIVRAAGGLGREWGGGAVQEEQGVKAL